VVVEPPIDDVRDISLKDGDPVLDVGLGCAPCEEVVHCSVEGCGMVKDLEEPGAAGVGLGYLGGVLWMGLGKDSKSTEELNGNGVGGRRRSISKLGFE
jgi:hypothetical protein